MSQPEGEEEGDRGRKSYREIMDYSQSKFLGFLQRFLLLFRETDSKNGLKKIPGMHFIMSSTQVKGEDDVK